MGQPSGLGDHSAGRFGERPLTLVKPVRVGKGLNRHASLCVLAGGGGCWTPWYLVTSLSLIKALRLLSCPLRPPWSWPGPSRSPYPELGLQGGRCQQTPLRPHRKVVGTPACWPLSW